MPNWTPEEIAEVKRLWENEGLSAGKIMKRFPGRSRNAVIGVIHRKKFASRGVNGNRELRRFAARPNPHLSSRRRKERPKKREKTVIEQIATEPLPTFEGEFVIPLAERKTIQNLEPGQCKWPIGDTQDAAFHFCGKAQVPGLPYCPHHCRRAFQPPQTKTRFRLVLESGRTIRTDKEIKEAPKELVDETL